MFIDTPDSPFVPEAVDATIAVEVEQRETMSPEEIAKICATEIDEARSRLTKDYKDDNTRALDYFHGRMDGDTPAQKGRSRAKSNDVADVIGWMMPGLVRVFFAGDDFAEFGAVRPEDQAVAQQASDYINYILMRECNICRVGWDAMHDALLERIGVIKFWWDPTQERSFSRHTGLDDAAYAQLVNDPDVEVMRHEVRPDPNFPGMAPAMMPMPQPPPPGVAPPGGVQPGAAQAPPGPPPPMVPPQMQMPAPPQLHDLDIVRTLRNGRVRIAAVPPEEFLIDSRATSTDDARFLCHWSQVTRSELVEQGFDRDKIIGLGPDSDLSTRPEATSRNEIGHSYLDDPRTDPAMEYVDRYEVYIQVDADGDGISEWLQVIMAGGTGAENILAIEPWGDPVPFAVLRCYNVPHRFLGRSVADDVMDLQQIKTVLIRSILDGTYMSNNPMATVIEEALKDPDQILNPGFGELIRVKAQYGGHDALRPVPMVFNPAAAFQLIQYIDDMIERRTGISRATMALDPEALTNQTATAVQKQADAAYSKIELVARNFADGGYKDLTRGVLRLHVKHQDRPRLIRLRNEFVAIDPRDWNAEMDVSINTGLGAGSKDRDMSMLAQLLQIQEKIITQAGADNPMVTPTHLYNTLAQLVRAAGMKNPDQFFAKLTPEQVKAEAEKRQGGANDPKTREAQAKLQMQQQMAQQKLTLDQQKAQQDAQLAQQKFAGEMELARFKAQQDAEAQVRAAVARADVDKAIAVQKLALEREIRFEELRMEQELRMAQITAGARGVSVNLPRPQ